MLTRFSNALWYANGTFGYAEMSQVCAKWYSTKSMLGVEQLETRAARKVWAAARRWGETLGPLTTRQQTITVVCCVRVLRETETS